MVEAARPRRVATIRIETPAATPREISSRSTSDRCRGERLLGWGRTPPHDSTKARIEAADRPRSRPINRFASPACHRSQTTTRSSSVNLTTTTSSMRHHSHRQVLHSPPETTALMGGLPRVQACKWTGRRVCRFTGSARPYPTRLTLTYGGGTQAGCDHVHRH